jgi:GTP-binding protein EngB required for normal cell division
VPRRTTFSDHTYVNVPPLLSPELVEQTSSNDEDEDTVSPPPISPDVIGIDKPVDLRNKIRTILQGASSNMVEEISTGLFRDLHIVVCGSPRVGKSTLINVMCGKQVAKAKEGLTRVTEIIECYTLEGPRNTGPNAINYKFNFWDTPGFEAWDKGNIKTKVKEIIETPESKPLCMIFCASPGTFVDLTQLDWLLKLCINKKHIFCALVCTNMYAGQTKARQAVLDAFNELLSKYSDDPPRIENDISFYGNIGLCAAVNSEPYIDEDRNKPALGTNELILGIMESLVDEEVLKWCFVVLENEGFWNNCHHKVSGFFDKAKDTNKIIKKLFGKKNKAKKKDSSTFYIRDN